MTTLDSSPTLAWARRATQDAADAAGESTADTATQNAVRHLVNAVGLLLRALEITRPQDDPEPTKDAAPDDALVREAVATLRRLTEAFRALRVPTPTLDVEEVDELRRRFLDAQHQPTTVLPPDPEDHRRDGALAALDKIAELTGGWAAHRLRGQIERGEWKP